MPATTTLPLHKPRTRSPAFQKIADRHLLPAWFRDARALALAWLLPLLSLTALDGWALWLAWSQMDDEQRGWGVLSMALHLGTLVVGLALTRQVHRRARPLHHLEAFWPLVTSLGLMIFGTFMIPEAFDRTLPRWMFDSRALMFYHWTAGMLTGVWATAVAASYPEGKFADRMKAAIVISLLVGLVMFGVLVGSAFSDSGGDSLVPVFIGCLTVASVGLGIGLVRLFLKSWEWFFQYHKPGEVAMGVVFSLVVGDGASWRALPAVPKGARLETFDPQRSTWRPVATDSAEDAPAELRELALLASRTHLLRQNPAAWEAHLPELVHASKQAHLLTPATAFMVLENDAQWKTLAMREVQKLSSHGILAFDEKDFKGPPSGIMAETPEPSASALLTGAVILALVMHRRRQAARMG